MINAGDFDKRITIVRRTPTEDADGFKSGVVETEVCKAWASINTTKGFTLITQGSSFEDATTRMLIRKPNAEIRDTDIVLFKGKEWRIRYLNEIDEDGIFTELQVETVNQKGATQNG